MTKNSVVTHIATSSLIAVLALALVSLSLSAGCFPDQRGRVNQVIGEAGKQDHGTVASWVKGGGTAKEALITSSPDGQWASSARASSSMGHVPYMPKATPEKATGPPDVPEFRVDIRAWGPAKENAGYEWIEFKYLKPVRATGVRIRETNGCGSVVMVQLTDTDGKYHTKWKGKDKGNLFITWLVLEFPPTSYLVDTVRVTMDTTLSYHWKMIDAVQLNGTP